MAKLAQILKESLPILFVMVIIEVIAGSILGNMEISLETLPGLLALIPAVLALRGNISTAMASRLGTWTRFGLVKPKQWRTGLIREQLIASLVLGIILSFASAILSHFITVLSGYESAGILALSAIAIGAGLLSGIIMGAIAILTMRLAFRYGYDMDNIGGPVLMTASDLFTILSLYVIGHLVGRGL